MARSAKGIPDRGSYGEPDKDVSEKELLDFVIQRHLARRAGPHYDLRAGTPEKGLLSFVSRKGVPSPKERRMLIQQPLHSHGYKDFEGTIESGYGAGEVKKVNEGQILVTKVKPGQIHFSTATGKHPERFVLIKPRVENPKHWLLINTTPTDPVPYKKIRYKKIPSAKVEDTIKTMAEGTSVQQKIDGASSLVKLLKDGIELVSYRASKETGRPILHTERFFGGKPEMKIPKKYVGSVLRGELYGVQDGKAVGPQTLGGLLNAGIARSLREQKQKNIQLQNMLFDIQQFGKHEIDLKSVPYSDRRRMLEEIVEILPSDKFHLAPEAKGVQEALELWRDIGLGKNPFTIEGVVMHPPKGKPMKAKYVEDHDVHVTGTFPGKGKYSDRVGGLTYALEPGGPTIGRVGTGFSDALRKQIAEDAESYKGRVARIRSQQQLPSGAFRAPAFLAFHEDY